MDAVQSNDRRTLISSLDSFTLLGLSKAGDESERLMALEELGARDIPVPSTVMDCSRRLLAAADRLDAALDQGRN